MCILMYVIACRDYTYIYSILFPFFSISFKMFPPLLLLAPILIHLCTFFYFPIL